MLTIPFPFTTVVSAHGHATDPMPFASSRLCQPPGNLARPLDFLVIPKGAVQSILVLLFQIQAHRKIAIPINARSVALHAVDDWHRALPC